MYFCKKIADFENRIYKTIDYISKICGYKSNSQDITPQNLKQKTFIAKNRLQIIKTEKIMIQDIKIKNYLSFRDEVFLSFEATKDRTREDNYVIEVAPGVRLLRFAMVMGANGSGKSNLLQAFDYLRRFWVEKPKDLEESTGVCPFLLDRETSTQPSEFFIRFWIKGTKYSYHLCLDQKQVYREALNVYRSVQPTNVFTRELVDGHTTVSFNPAVEKISEVAIEKLQLECLNNMSLFAARQKVNLSLTVFDEVAEWMRTAFKPIIDPEIKMYEWAIDEMMEDEDIKKHILKFLHTSDFNICDIRSKVTTTEVPEKFVNFMLNAPLSSETKEQLEKYHTINQLNTNFVHHVVNHRGEEEYTMSDEYQSYGTRRIIGMETAIFEATKEGSILVIDELEASMHHDLVLYVLGKYLMQKSESQMLVTTHCTPLLAWLDKLIRKDSVWFTDRERNGSTNLYTLVEFKGLNRMNSIQNAYLAGKFGAIPNITISNSNYQDNTEKTNADE